MSEEGSEPELTGVATGEPELARVLQLMVMENRRRDDMLATLAERLIPATRMGEAEAMKMVQVVPDMDKGIECFTAEGGISAAEWILNIEGMRALHRWSDALALEVARIHLGGAAKNWYRTAREETRTWEDFQREFKATFGERLGLPERWRRMEERVQKRGENLSAYYYDKVHLCKKVGLQFQETKEQVIVGLWSKDLATTMMARTHLLPNDLYHDLLQFERINAARTERTKATNRITIVSEEERPRAVTKGIGVTDDGTKQRSTGGKAAKCYNCGKTGHLSRDCPDPKATLRCYKCNEIGHTQWKCPAKRQGGTLETSAQVLATGSDFQEWQGAKFCKRVTINDAQVVDGLVDTGSSDCIMRASAAVRCRLVVNSSDVQIHGFGAENSATVRALGVCMVTMQVDEVRVSGVRILVVEDNVQPTELLIGRSFTERPEIAYVRKGDRLLFGYAEEEPFKNLVVEAGNEMTLRATENLVVQPLTVTTVGAQVNCLHVRVQVSNVTPCAQVLHVGQTLARNLECDNDSYGKVVNPITRDELNVGDDMSANQVEQLLTLINEFRECFAVNLNELGCTNVIEMTISEEEGSRPIHSKPYRASISERKEMQEIIKEWREHGIVTDTTSPYTSPVLLVKKSSGESRLVVDYRRLNQQTVRQTYPLPRIEDLVDRLEGGKLFTTLDLAHGYLQVPLASESRRKTAFITPDETGEFTRMVFGLRNAPFEFTRLMSIVLGPLQNTIAMCYVDDILVPATDWGDMLSRLRKVFEALKTGGLTLKLKKCVFGENQVNYLGLRISEGTVKPGEGKLTAIEEFPRPKDRHEIRRFLGLVGYFRRFVKDFARKASPLTRLTKKDEPFNWEEAQEESFQVLKRDLTTGPSLKMYRPTAYTELHTDASKLGLAGLLLQRDETDGRMHLVCCVSKKTTEAESKYHSSKLELMAIVWSLDRLRVYLLGLRVLVVTDCQALVYMNVNRTKSAQITRWASLIQEYDVEFKHRAGEKMAHVDALSRAPVEMAGDTELKAIEARLESLVALTEEEYVLAIQYSDHVLRCKIDQLKETGGEDAEYVLQGGCLYRKVEKTNQLKYVVPKSMRKSMAVRFHDQLGHFGVDRTIRALAKNYWFAGMRRYLRIHIRRCAVCVLNKIPAGTRAGQLHPIPPGSRPFEVVNIDHLGPFVTSTKGKSYILVLVDNLTKYVRLWAVKNTSTKEALKVLEDFVLDVGLPNKIISDRGTCFTSTLFDEFCIKNGIQHILISVRHPQSNGQVERVNRTLLPVIQAEMADNERTWDRRLMVVQRNLNAAVNKSTNKTPFEMLYGFQPRFTDGVLRRLTEAVDEEQNDVNLVRAEAVERISGEHTRWSEAYNRKHHTITYDVGEVVFLRVSPISTGVSTKTQPKYRGPLVVTAALDGDTYRVCDLRETTGRHYATVAHVSLLKSFPKSKTEKADDVEDSSASESSGTDEDQERPCVSDCRDARPSLKWAVAKQKEKKKGEWR